MTSNITSIQAELNLFSWTNETVYIFPYIWWLTIFHLRRLNLTRRVIVKCYNSVVMRGMSVIQLPTVSVDDNNNERVAMNSCYLVL